MPLLRHLARLDIPGGGQVVAEGDHAFVGHMHPPEGTSIIDVADPRRPRIVSQVSLPAHTHSHKVRVHGDIMLVNNELFRADDGRAPGRFRGRHQDLRHRRPHEAAPDRALQIVRLAPLRFGRALCLHLVGGGRLCRRHRRHPRPRRPDPARADRALVDAGAMGGRRRDPDLAGPPASLPSPAAPRQPALYQLLAWRLRDPRHRRHPPPEIYQRPRLEPALSVPDPYRSCRSRTN